MNARDTMIIPDVQSSADSRQLPINKVGIKSIRHPVKVLDKSGGVQHTIANFNMYVGLPHNFKGTHMSRFVEILNSRDKEISVESFEAMLREMVEKLEAETGIIEMSFPYFINKEAPVSKVKSLMDYEVTFIGEILEGDVYRQTMKVRGAGDQPVPLLEEDLRLRCAQPALAHHRHRHHQQLPVDRGTGADGRGAGFLRGLRPAQASGREVRHRARLRQPEVRRGHGARRRRRAQRRSRASTPTCWNRRTSSPSTTTRPTPSSSATSWLPTWPSVKPSLRTRSRKRRLRAARRTSSPAACGSRCCG